jgi:ATP-dependent Clp protease ATP-binding subunit ClpX
MAATKNIKATAEPQQAQANNGIKNFTPKDIKEYLDKYVIGQEAAKKTLSVAVYNHYKKILNDRIDNGVEMDKSNIILLGSTGSGKTLLVKTIARMLNVPCYIQDCTKITESGYVGSDVEECLVGLLRTCDYKVELAQMGIVMLDEGDKLRKSSAGVSLTRDVGGEGVQQSLLKIVEGDLVGVPPAGGRKHPEQPLIYVDTKNILFILSGAFVGIEDVVKRRTGSTKIGFTTETSEERIDDEKAIEYVTHEDVKNYGFIPELVGRFPIITHVNKLSEEDLVRIIKEPRNSLIKQYTALLDMDNTDLEVTDDALLLIAKIALSMDTGARGLRTVFETLMEDTMYTAPENTKGNRKRGKVVIDTEFVKAACGKKYSSILKDVA